jgi:DNA-binding response OmpR family regulator
MRQKVLAIDPNPYILSIIKSTLESAGYKVLTALDGESGLEQFHYRQPDLIILDVMLPHLNGWEVARRIRRVSQIPLLIHTTVEAPEYLLQAAKVGSCNYLVKPVLPEILIKQVKLALNLQTQHEQPLPQSARPLPLPTVTVAEYA